MTHLLFTTKQTAIKTKRSRNVAPPKNSKIYNRRNAVPFAYTLDQNNCCLSEFKPEEFNTCKENA